MDDTSQLLAQFGMLVHKVMDDFEADMPVGVVFTAIYLGENGPEGESILLGNDDGMKHSAYCATSKMLEEALEQAENGTPHPEEKDMH